MRAVKNDLPTPSGKVEESDDLGWTRAFEDRPGYPRKGSMGVGSCAQWM